MSKLVERVFSNATLSLSLCTDGFWLWDVTRNMNLSMRVKTERDAFVETIDFYQKRLTKVETDYRALKDSVDKFVEQHCEHEDHEE